MYRRGKYFIRYKSKDFDWQEMRMFLGGRDDLDSFLMKADEMRSYGHRDVRVIEIVMTEREVSAK